MSAIVGDPVCERLLIAARLLGRFSGHRQPCTEKLIGPAYGRPPAPARRRVTLGKDPSPPAKHADRPLFAPAAIPGGPRPESRVARTEGHAVGASIARFVGHLLSRSLERRLNLRREEIEVQAIGIVFERMKAESLPPRPRSRVQGGDDDGAACRLLVELDCCGEDVRCQGGPDADVGVAAVDSQPAEQESRNRIRGALGDDFRRSGAIDASHRDARVGHDKVVGVGDDPGSGGVRMAVLAGVAAQPLVEDRFSAVELAAVMSARVQRRRAVQLSQAS